jgi:hypothetical protein
MLHRRCRRNAQLVTVHATFTEKLAGLEDRDNGFLALFGKDGELDLAFLNIIHGIGDIALLEHLLVRLDFENRLSGSDFRKESLRIKLIIGWRRQQQAPSVLAG